YDEARRGWLYPLDLNEKAKTAYKKEDFNHIRIEAIGNETKTWVNGTPVGYVVDTLDPTGFIGLQVHSIGDDALAGKKVYFKNIRIQTENLQPQDFPTGIYPVNLTPNSLSAYEEQSGYKLLFDSISTTSWLDTYDYTFLAKRSEMKNSTITVLPAEGGESTNEGVIVTSIQLRIFALSF